MTTYNADDVNLDGVRVEEIHLEDIAICLEVVSALLGLQAVSE